VVRVLTAGRGEERVVTVGAMNRHEAVLTSGIDEGAVLARNIAGPGAH
jgi:hypothetical protein